MSRSWPWCISTGGLPLEPEFTMTNYSVYSAKSKRLNYANRYAWLSYDSVDKDRYGFLWCVINLHNRRRKQAKGLHVTIYTIPVPDNHSTVLPMSQWAFLTVTHMTALTSYSKYCCEVLHLYDQEWKSLHCNSTTVSSYMCCKALSTNLSTVVEQCMRESFPPQQVQVCSCHLCQYVTTLCAKKASCFQQATIHGHQALHGDPPTKTSNDQHYPDMFVCCQDCCGKVPQFVEVSQ